MKPNEWLKHIVSEVRGQTSLDDHLAPNPTLSFGVPRADETAFPWLLISRESATTVIGQVRSARRSAVVAGDDAERISVLSQELAKVVEALPVVLGDAGIAREATWRAALTGAIDRPRVSIHFPVVFGNNEQAAVLRLKLYALPDCPGVVAMAPFVNHPDNTHSLLTTHVGRTFMSALQSAAELAQKDSRVERPVGIAWSLESAWEPDGYPDATALVDGGSVGVAAYLAFRSFYEHYSADLHTVCATGAIVDGEPESVAEVTTKHEAFQHWSQGIMARRYLADRLPDHVDTKKANKFSSLDDAWKIALDPAPPLVLSSDPQIEAAYKSSLHVRAERCRKVFGREEDVENVQRLVLDQESGGLVVVHGPAGVGKSSFIGELVNQDWGDAAVASFFISQSESFLIPQRETATSIWDCIHQTLLAQLHVDGIGRSFTTLKDLVLSYEGKRIVFVIDGVDETSVDPQGIWTWEISRHVTVVLGVRGTRSQVAERLPIYHTAGASSQPRPCHYYSLDNLPRSPFDHWIRSVLEHAELPEEELGQVTQVLWDRTEGYPLFTDRLIGQLLSPTESPQPMPERAKKLPATLVAFVGDEWRSMKRTAGSKWIPAVVAARGAVDQEWLDRLPEDLRPGPLTDAGEPIQRWVLEFRASDSSLDPGVEIDVRARSVAYDLGHPALREAFEQVEDLQMQIAAIETCVLEVAKEHILLRAKHEHYRWEDAVGIDRYDARYLMDHVIGHLKHIRRLITADPNRARPLMVSAMESIKIIIGDADFWAGWLSEVGVTAAKRTLRGLMRVLREWERPDCGLIDLLETMTAFLDNVTGHLQVGVDRLVALANHAGMTPAAKSARWRLDRRGDAWLCRICPRHVPRSAIRVTVQCEGGITAMVRLSGVMPRMAVGTDAGEVRLLDEDGEEVPGSRSRVQGSVTSMVALGEGRFAVGTRVGVVAVFNLDGESGNEAWNQQPRVSGGVTSMVALGDGRFAVGTEEDIIAVFDATGQAVDPDWTQKPRVLGGIISMVALGAGSFAVGTWGGIVAVFKSGGEPVNEDWTQKPRVSGWMKSIVAIGEGRFAVATHKGVVAVFNSGGEPVNEEWTQKPRVSTFVESMVALSGGRFAVGTSYGAVAVFKSDGEPVNEEWNRESRVSRGVLSMVHVGDGRFAVGTPGVFDTSGTFVLFDAKGLRVSDEYAENDHVKGRVQTMADMAEGLFAVGTSYGTVAVFNSNAQPDADGWDGANVYFELELVLALGEGRFAIGTADGVVEVFDAEGQPMYGWPERHVTGTVTSMVALGDGRFAVGTSEGIVAVFDAEGQTVYDEWTQESRVLGDVSSMVALSNGHVAVGTGEGIVAVFDTEGQPVCKDWTRNRRVSGWVESMVDLGDGRFAVATRALGTGESEVSLFNADGVPMNMDLNQDSRILGRVTSMLALGHGRFAVATQKGVVAVFAANGKPVKEEWTQNSRVSGDVGAMVVLGQDRFAVGTSESVVALFNADGEKLDETQLPRCGGWCSSFGEAGGSLHGFASQRGYVAIVSPYCDVSLADHMGTSVLHTGERQGFARLVAFDGDSGPYLFDYHPARR